MTKKRTNVNGPPSDGESVVSYFRRVFQENPALLGQRSNDCLLETWLRDHPGQTEIPNAVKKGLSNIRSALRSKGRNRTARKASRQAQHMQEWLQQPTARTQPASSPMDALENLERHIDECLLEARLLAKDGLEDVINHLRRARNAVVWKIGQ